MRLDGRVAVVTGGDKGIGRAITLALAAHGAQVVIANRDRELAMETAALTAKVGETAAWVKTDVTSSDDVNHLVTKVSEDFGKIDIFVNNSGVSSIGRIWEISEADFDWNYQVNTKGVFLCCKAVAPIMIRQHSGTIINIASRAAKVSVEYQGHYGATKAAVLLLTRNFASELAPYGVRVNAICPGKVDTGMLRGEWDDEVALRGQSVEEIEADIIRRTPMRRLVRPEDVANVTVFMASDYSSAMTGQSINVTCGLEMR